MTTNSTDDANRGYTITRTFAAPRERVWQAITDPEQFSAWWGGAAMQVKDCAMDVREGGQWRATMVLPDGGTIPWAGEYLAVQAPERLVMTLADQEPGSLKYDTMTFRLADTDGAPSWC